jgi:hypothetical protein
MSWMLPPPEGYRIAPRNPDGTLKDPRTPAQRKAAQEKVLADRKVKMERYFSRTREAQERLVKAAKGVKDKVEAPALTDELDFVVQNFLAEPALLEGKGAVPLSILTPEQKRARQRARLDAQSADARAALDKAIKGDDDDDDSGFNFDTYEGLSDSEADGLIENDPEADDLSFLDEFDLGGEDK